MHLVENSPVSTMGPVENRQPLINSALKNNAAGITAGSRTSPMREAGARSTAAIQPRHHALITGTGRSGTTFLVQLLTHLGLETGFSADEVFCKIGKESHAGLEADIRSADCPYLVKSPWFCNYADEIINRNDIVIDHVFIPIRNLNAAAESRRHVEKTTVSKLSLLARLKHALRPRVSGGLWLTQSNQPGIQEEILAGQVYKLMLAIADTTIPVTFLHYPRIAKDCSYLYGKLQPLLSNISYQSFLAEFRRVVRPELVHCFNNCDR